jgi:mannose-1-phosphate guanylyltransferase / mannose-6-phosphate isomerase
MVVPVILSGGSGTRLWPLSRERTPKQLLPLVTPRTLLQDTALRASALQGEAPIVICNEAHRFQVAEQLRAIGHAPGAIVLEPAGRNTAPAVAVAALLAMKQARDSAVDRASDADPLLMVLPADHVVLDLEAFAAAARAALRAAEEGRLVTFGVSPNKPETGYGYIRRGADRGDWAVLEQFVEKPDHVTAKRYVTSGRYLWNSGMFVLPAGAYLSELGRFAPAILEACTRAVETADVDQDFTRLGACFEDCPADSIDYAVMERTDRAAVVPLDAGWSDVGSWPALQEILHSDGYGNVLRGDVIAENCRDSYVAAHSRLVVALGLDEHVVVETPDAVLVMARRESQKLKDVVESLRAAGRGEIEGTEGQ